MPRFCGLHSHSPIPHDANERMFARKREREDVNPSRTLVAQMTSLSHSLTYNYVSLTPGARASRLKPSRHSPDRPESSVRSSSPSAPCFCSRKLGVPLINKFTHFITHSSACKNVQRPHTLARARMLTNARAAHYTRTQVILHSNSNKAATHTCTLHQNKLTGRSARRRSAGRAQAWSYQRAASPRKSLTSGTTALMSAGSAAAWST